MKEVWKVVAAFIGVFIAGSVFGGLFSLGVGSRIVNRPPQPPPLQPQMLRMYSAQLDLTETQKSKLEPLVDRANDELNRLRTQQFEVSRAVLQKLHKEFASELTSAQRDKLAIIERRQLEQQQRDMIGRRGGPGARGSGPGGGRVGQNPRPLGAQNGGRAVTAPRGVPAPVEPAPVPAP